MERRHDLRRRVNQHHLDGLYRTVLTGLVQVIGLKRTILGCMALLAAGTGLSLLMSSPWQLFLTWGVMVGIGAGAGAVGMAAAVANRWFVERSGSRWDCSALPTPPDS